jgi:peptidoglycan/xylan/chitin deacetylase (PgdA/CDA1 family)
LLTAGALAATVAAHAESPAEALQRRVAVKALRRGDTGPEVTALQQLLRQVGVDPGKVDGIFGPLTEQAVRQAQVQAGVGVDGLAGRATVGALSAAPVAAKPAVAPVAASTTTSAMVRASDGVTGPRAPTATLVSYLAAPESVPENPPEPPAEPDRFALTFNGVPDPNLLPPILEALRRHDMKATFFVYGQTAQEQPDLLRQIVDAGHEIGNNGIQDLDMRRLTPSVMGAQVRASNRAIKEATGQAPVWFRPPRGLATQQVRETARSNGLRWTMWTNVTVTDSAESSPEELAAALESTVYPGAVLMLHQDRPATVAALDGLLAQLAFRGYRGTTLSDLGE